MPDEAVLFVCNYAAPALIKSDVTTGIFSMVGHMLGSELGKHCCGLLLSPAYSYQKHHLFLEEHALLKILSSNSCVVDASFQLTFDVKSKTVPCLSFTCSAWVLRISGTTDQWPMVEDSSRLGTKPRIGCGRIRSSSSREEPGRMPCSWPRSTWWCRRIWTQRRSLLRPMQGMSKELRSMPK